MDWHGSFEKYADAKFRINMNQSGDDLIIINHDDCELSDNLDKHRGTKGAFASKNFNNGEITNKAYT
ncbi:MAG: Mur ligase family protein, partial [Ignavibacteria bacterium]